MNASEVHLSRLVVQADTTEMSLADIDFGVVTRFCGDSDGCQIVVRLERPAEARTLTARLFVNAGVDGRWFSSESGGAYFTDADNSINRVLRLDAGPTSCIVDDGNAYDPGLDEYPGFEVGVGGDAGNPATCTITVSD